MDLKAKIHLQEEISYMDIGKIINHLSSRLRSRSQAVHAKLRIENAQGEDLKLYSGGIRASSRLPKRYRKGFFSPHYSIKFIVENSVNKTKVT